MAKPIVDMFSWNAPGNTLQDLYNWYLEGGDEDAGGGGGGGTGGITNAYVGGDDGAFDYLNNPVAPVTTSGTGEQIVANKALRDLGYTGNIYDPKIDPADPVYDANLKRLGLDTISANPWAGEIGPYYEGYNEDMLPAAGQGTIPDSALNDVFQYIKQDPAKYNNMSNEEVYAEMREKGKFLDNPFGWAKQKWGNLTPGQQKTGILGVSSFLPFPLNIVGMASQFLPKSEGYAVGGLDPMGKGLYNTLAAEDMLFEHSTGLKTITGKNLVFGDTLVGNNYVEGQQEIWDENYAGKSEDEILAEFKAYARKHNKKDYGNTLENWKNSNTYMFNKYFESKATTGYLNQVKENQKKEINRIQKKIDDSTDIAKDAPVKTPPKTSTFQESWEKEDKDTGGGQPQTGGGDYGGGYERDEGGGGYSGRGYHWAQGGRVKYSKGGIVDLL